MGRVAAEELLPAVAVAAVVVAVVVAVERVVPLLFVHRPDSFFLIFFFQSCFVCCCCCCSCSTSLKAYSSEKEKQKYGKRGNGNTPLVQRLVTLSYLALLILVLSIELLTWFVKKQRTGNKKQKDKEKNALLL